MGSNLTVRLSEDIMESWALETDIRLLPTYPQGNGQAEAVNKVIVSGLKKRLDEAKRKWVDELPNVLWTLHHTPKIN